MYSNTHSEPERVSVRLKRAPRSSITTISPGSSSRSTRAPMRSKAHVSDASTQASSSRPTTSGRMPSGSRNPARPRSLRTTAAKAPSIRPIASATASPRSSESCWTISAAITSVSDVDRIDTRRASSSSRSAAVLVRLPLCPSAIVRPPAWRTTGWAFCHTVEPVVE